jgi:hypothetical protein
MIRHYAAVCALLTTLGCSSNGSSDDPGSAVAPPMCAAEGDCELCLMCALSGSCKSSVDACADSSECMAFRSCLPESDDAAAIAGCKNDHPSGASDFCDYVECSVYEQCGTVCEPSQVCPR